jgi:hypothetical protein
VVIIGRMADAAPKKRSERNPHKHASDRYEGAARGAMKMSDDLMRDASMRQIVELCLRRI